MGAPRERVFGLAAPETGSANIGRPGRRGGMVAGTPWKAASLVRLQVDAGSVDPTPPPRPHLLWPNAPSPVRDPERKMSPSCPRSRSWGLGRWGWCARGFWRIGEGLGLG